MRAAASSAFRGRLPVHNRVLPGIHVAKLLLGEAQIHQPEAVLAIGTEFHRQAGGRALRSRSGIVEFVRQVTRKFAQGRELLGLLLDAGDFADAVEQGGDHALRHAGNGLEHGRKQ